MTFPAQSLSATSGQNTFTAQVVVKTTGATASPTSSTASVTDTSGLNDPNLVNNTATSSGVIITPESSLALNLTGPTGTVNVGDTVTYTINASNSGPSDEPNAVVTDTLDPNVTFVSATGGVTPVGNTLTFDLGELAAGSSAPQLQIRVIPTKGAAVPLTGTISNTAKVSGNNYDPNGTPSQTVTTTVNASADLQLTSLQATANPLVEQPLTFTINAINNGPSDATGVMLEDTLPSNLADWNYVSATTNIGIMPMLSGNVVTANISTLASGASVIMTVTVTPTLAAITDSPLSDTATISGLQDDLVNNNTQMIPFTVSPAVDLVTSLTSSPSGIVEVQGDLTYKASVKNMGPSNATNVTLVDTLPANVQFVSATGGVTPVGNQLIFNIGSLDVNGSATVQFVVAPTTASLASPSLTNTVSAQATEALVSQTDGTASITTQVLDHVGTFEFSSSSYSVADDAGEASITVSRVNGTRGTVTVGYTTVVESAVPGYDYTPVSGTLTFAPDVTSQTIVVPVLDNPYASSNTTLGLELTGVQTSIPAGQPGQAVLGTPSTAALTIQVLSPNLSPLTVANIQWTGSTQNVQQIYVTFNKPLIASTAKNLLNYTLVNVGPDGKYGTLDDSDVPLNAVAYDLSSWTVALTPSQPLSANQFFHLQITSTPGGIEDVGGNMLAGNGSTAGTDFTAMVAHGTSLRYYTPAGDQVNLKITGGGTLNDWLSGTGQGVEFVVVGEVPHHTVLSGSVKKVRGGTGEAYLGYTLWGLGKFGDVRVKLHSPKFQVTQYPFSPGSLASKSSTPTAQTLARTAAIKTASKLRSTRKAAAMSRPFHAFHR